MTSLWTLSDMGAAMRADKSGALPADTAGISIDSRTLGKGDAFFAIQGENRDGHDFVEAALKAGAGLAVVARAQRARFAADAPLLLVDDVLEALRALARAARARLTAQVVAVTGSVGKTGTKEALRLALSADGETHASAASYNNHWGVPLTLARCPRGAAYAVVEIGMNNPGEIAPLSRLARPHVAVVTSIGAAHIGHLGGLDAIAAEKATISEGLEPGGVAVLPTDTTYMDVLRRAAGAARVLTFGEGGDARAMAVSTDAEGSTVSADVAGRTVEFRLGAPGAHIARNALCALAAVAALGADPAAVAPRLREVRAMQGRGAQEQVRTPDGGSATVIDESFNGQPPSVRAALALLRILPAGRRVAALGQMGELGDFAADEHRALAPHVRDAADLVFLCGPLMRHLAEALPPGLVAAHTQDSAELAPLVAAAVRDGDAVLVKGSKAMLMGRVLSALRGDRA